jgi:hypothetical protein
MMSASPSLSLSVSVSFGSLLAAFPMPPTTGAFGTFTATSPSTTSVGTLSETVSFGAVLKSFPAQVFKNASPRPAEVPDTHHTPFANLHPLDSFESSQSFTSESLVYPSSSSRAARPGPLLLASTNGDLVPMVEKDSPKSSPAATPSPPRILISSGSSRFSSADHASASNALLNSAFASSMQQFSSSASASRSRRARHPFLPPKLAPHLAVDLPLVVTSSPTFNSSPESISDDPAADPYWTEMRCMFGACTSTCPGCGGSSGYPQSAPAHIQTFADRTAVDDHILSPVKEGPRKTQRSSTISIFAGKVVGDTMRSFGKRMSTRSTMAAHD